MGQHSEKLITAWQRPWWAQTSESDEDALIHTRHLGRVVSLDGEELGVELVQRDELHWDSPRLSITRDGAWVRVAGFRVGVDEAMRLSEHLRAIRTWGARGSDLSARPTRMPWPSHHRAAG